MYYKTCSKWARVLWIALFVLYAALLLRLTMLRDGLFVSHPRAEDRVILVPFWSYSEFLRQGQYIQFRYQLIGNVLCLLPLGFFCGFFKKDCSLVRAALTCLGATLCIECWQLAFDVGYFELDDLSLNLVGGIIGYALYLLVRDLYGLLTKKT